MCASVRACASVRLPVCYIWLDGGGRASEQADRATSGRTDGAAEWRAASDRRADERAEGLGCAFARSGPGERAAYRRADGRARRPALACRRAHRRTLGGALSSALI